MKPIHKDSLCARATNRMAASKHRVDMNVLLRAIHRLYIYQRLSMSYAEYRATLTLVAEMDLETVQVRAGGRAGETDLARVQGSAPDYVGHNEPSGQSYQLRIKQE